MRRESRGGGRTTGDSGIDFHPLFDSFHTILPLLFPSLHSTEFGCFEFTDVGKPEEVEFRLSECTCDGEESANLIVCCSSDVAKSLEDSLECSDDGGAGGRGV